MGAEHFDAVVRISELDALVLDGRRNWMHVTDSWNRLVNAFAGVQDYKYKTME